jgi:hypothetical protein
VCECAQRSKPRSIINMQLGATSVCIHVLDDTNDICVCGAHFDSLKLHDARARSAMMCILYIHYTDCGIILWPSRVLSCCYYLVPAQVESRGRDPRGRGSGQGILAPQENCSRVQVGSHGGVIGPCLLSVIQTEPDRPPGAIHVLAINLLHMLVHILHPQCCHLID